MFFNFATCEFEEKNDLYYNHISEKKYVPVFNKLFKLDLSETQIKNLIELSKNINFQNFLLYDNFKDIDIFWLKNKREIFDKYYQIDQKFFSNFDIKNLKDWKKDSKGLEDLSIYNKIFESKYSLYEYLFKGNEHKINIESIIKDTNEIYDLAKEQKIDKIFCHEEIVNIIMPYINGNYEPVLTFIKNQKINFSQNFMVKFSDFIKSIYENKTNYMNCFGNILLFFDKIQEKPLVLIDFEIKENCLYIKKKDEEKIFLSCAKNNSACAIF